MPDDPVVVDIPGVGEVEFPSSMSQSQIDTAAARLYSQNQAKAAPASTPSPSTANIGGLALAGAAKAAPAIAHGAEELATSPAVPRIAASIGRAVGGIAPTVVGAYEGGPLGALVGLAAGTAKGAWMGGRTGWFTGKMLQNLSAPAAKAVAAVAPYAEMISGPLGAMSAESDALTRLNDPKELQKLKDTAIDHLRTRMNSPDLVNNERARAGIAASIKKLGGTP